MRLAIVSDPNRMKDDSVLVEEAEGLFYESLHVPFTKVIVSLKDGVNVKIDNRDLSEFDYFLPLPTRDFNEFTYTLLRAAITQLHIPISAENFLMATNEILLTDVLSDNKINYVKYKLISSDKTLEWASRKIKYPAVVRLQNKNVSVTNSQTLRDVLKLTKKGVPNKVERFQKETDYWTFVVGENVIASYKLRGDEAERVKNPELDEMALKTKSLIGCDYCVLKFIKNNGVFKFDKISFAPNFKRFHSITKVDVAKKLIQYVHDRSAGKEQKKGLLDIIERLIKK